MTDTAHVPVQQDTDTAPRPARTITVQRGDTCWAIAVRYGLTLPQLMRANPQVQDANQIYPGMKLCIDAPQLPALTTAWHVGDCPFGSPLDVSSFGFLPAQWSVTMHFAQSYDTVRSKVPPSFWGQYHPGVDVWHPACGGMNVYSVADGRVSYAGLAAADWHNIVVIEHDNGVHSRAAHLKDVNVKAGGRVRRGAVIGWIDGEAVGLPNHLHFELIRDGLLELQGWGHWSGNSLSEINEYYLDPITYIEAHGFWLKEARDGLANSQNLEG